MYLYQTKVKNYKKRQGHYTTIKEDSGREYNKSLGHGSSGRAPAEQAQGSEFKPQYHKKEDYNCKYTCNMHPST
jgi:hypothetical protein